MCVGREGLLGERIGRCNNGNIFDRVKAMEPDVIKRQMTSHVQIAALSDMWWLCL